MDTIGVNELQKYLLIKRDVRDLRKIIFGNDEHIHDWDRILIIYTIFLMYQHVFLLYNVMDKIVQHNDFNFKRYVTLDDRFLEDKEITLEFNLENTLKPVDNKIKVCNNYCEDDIPF